MKTADITVHLASPLLDRLERLANLNGKSVAEMVELYIKQQIEGPAGNSHEVLPENTALPGRAIPLRPATLTPAEAAEWDYYTSPEAMALYAKMAANYPVSEKVRSLRGIAAGLSPEDLKKTAKEWRAEAIESKYGV